MWRSMLPTGQMGQLDLRELNLKWWGLRDRPCKVLLQSRIDEGRRHRTALHGIDMRHRNFPFWWRKRKVVCGRQKQRNSLRMPPFISPESVKELNEVMCVTNDNWTPIPMYCSNCGALLYGYRNDEGKIKYECKRCGTVAVRVQKGRRHDKIDLYAPEGQVRYYWSDKTEYGKTTEWLRWNRLRNSISRSLALNTSVG